MALDIPRIIKRYSWLLYLIVTLLLYTLGVGVASYLGGRPEFGLYFLGLSWVLCTVLFTYFAYRRFDEKAAAENLGREYFGFLSWRSAMLVGAVISATITASSTLMMIQLDVLTQEIWILMLITVVGVCLYTLPPARLAISGYGELLLSVLLAAVVPALGLMIFLGEYHRFLAMIAFPLVALHLSMTIALGLPNYATQQKYEIKTMLMRMGWENSMTAHNLLILSAFLLIAVASLFGFPRFALFPSLLVFPLGGFEIYYMMRIAAGAKPNWNGLAIAAISLFLLPIYIFALAFWTR